MNSCQWTGCPNQATHVQSDLRDDITGAEPVYCSGHAEAANTHNQSMGLGSIQFVPVTAKLAGLPEKPWTGKLSREWEDAYREGYAQGLTGGSNARPNTGVGYSSPGEVGYDAGYFDAMTGRERRVAAQVDPMADPTDLWSVAAGEVEAERATLELQAARDSLGPTWAFLVEAESAEDLANRKALVAGQLKAVASGPVLAQLYDAIDAEHRKISKRREAQARKGAERLVRAQVAAEVASRTQAVALTAVEAEVKRRKVEAVVTAALEAGMDPEMITATAAMGVEFSEVDPSVKATCGVCGGGLFVVEMSDEYGGKFWMHSERSRDATHTASPQNIQGEAARTDPGYGQPYGGEGPSYTTSAGDLVWMHHQGSKVRFFDASGGRVGPEHHGIAPAAAWAISQGWTNPLLTSISSPTAIHKGAPFAGYADFGDCLAANQDADDPKAYCGEIKHRSEDKEGSRKVAKNCSQCGGTGRRNIVVPVTGTNQLQTCDWCDGSGEEPPDDDPRVQWLRSSGALEKAAWAIEDVRGVLSGGPATVDGMLLDAYTAQAIMNVWDRSTPEQQAKFSSLPLGKAVTIVWKLHSGAATPPANPYVPGHGNPYAPPYVDPANPEPPATADEVVEKEKASVA